MRRTSARPLVSARSWADGGISDTANMAWRRSCTVADSGSSCKVETPFGCRKRKGAICALDADVHSVIHHRVAFSGTLNGFPPHLQLRLSDCLFSNQVRTWDMKGVASRAIQGSALPSPPPLPPSSPSASSSSSSSSSSSKTTASRPTTIARLSSPSSSATFTKRSLGA